ncbi:MAG: DUF4260 domain-containing protein [Halobacteriota archaeon]
MVLSPRRLLQIEGLVVFVGATVAFFWVGGSVLLFVLSLLVPDLSMVGYLRDEHVGSALYNFGHLYLVPAVVGVVGVWQGSTPLLLGACVWTAHIGMDRAIGFGLKYPTAFGDTHFDRV